MVIADFGIIKHRLSRDIAIHAGLIRTTGVEMKRRENQVVAEGCVKRNGRIVTVNSAEPRGGDDIVGAERASLKDTQIDSYPVAAIIICDRIIDHDDPEGGGINAGAICGSVANDDVADNPNTCVLIIVDIYASAFVISLVPGDIVVLDERAAGPVEIQAAPRGPVRVVDDHVVEDFR